MRDMREVAPRNKLTTVVVLIQRVFRRVCEKETRRIGQENESVYSNGMAQPTRNIHD